jgi:hypothetical protein
MSESLFTSLVHEVGSIDKGWVLLEGFGDFVNEQITTPPRQAPISI